MLSKKSDFNWKLLTSKRYGRKKSPLQAFSVRFILADAYLEFVGHFPNPSDTHLGAGGGGEYIYVFVHLLLGRIVWRLKRKLW